MIFHKKLDNVHRSRQKFCERYASWLQRNVRLKVSTAASDAEQPKPSSVRGRPQISFEEASTKTKKRRVKELVACRTSTELRFAADLADKLPAHPRRSSLTLSKSSLSPHQALALYLDLDLSDRKYKLLRSVVNGAHNNCFPSLYSLNVTKNSLLPTNMTVDDISASVNLLELLELTVQSIIKIVRLEGSNELKLVCKWGFDGSSGHSQYKQTFTNASSTDEYLFLIAMVPLKLVDMGTQKDVWINPRPSSTLYCRPIKFIFQKETAELVRHEESMMSNTIGQLQTSEIELDNGRKCRVNFEMLFTMLDGSVSNILSNTNSTSKCCICGAKPTEMNTENVVNRPPAEEQYRFGLSTLHCWIRFFECVLHIGYRLPIKKWQVRGNELKEIVEKNKKRIQSEFKAKMGLWVDKPKPGYGSTNDGNTARRFFSNPDLSSEITGVNKDLIYNFSIILRVLASGYSINVDRFKLLLEETRKLYIHLYDWYYMPSSVHKILIHGCEVIASFSLPIGQLSEDALEARHKEVRKHRLHHTRKFSRVSSNTDLLRMLLLTSEPLISSTRQTVTREKLKPDGDIRKYIEEPEKLSSSLNEGDYNLMNIDNLTIDSESSSEENLSDSD